MKKKIKIEYEEDEEQLDNSDKDNEDDSDEDYVEVKKKTKTTRKSKKTTIIIKDESDTSSLSLAPCQHSISKHNFKENEIKEIRESMLEWYKKSKRDLPWRVHGKELTENEIAYRVWVSEIMLQQTKVITVIDYFNKWVAKWPTIKDLASTTIEEVNKLWSGLGYYRRAKNLYLGAQYVVKNYNSIIPKDIQQLKDIPGIGPYTSGAISSIAFNQAVPLVDGNVIRVFSRVRSIGANPKLSATVKLFWSLGSDLVDKMDNPGDFNQSIMELGATICSVQSPQCKQCPIQSNCNAYKQELEFIKPESKNSISRFFQPVNNSTTTTTTTTTSATTTPILKITDICNVCESFQDSDGPTESVTRFPKKVVKAKARDENVNVFLIHHSKQDKYLLTQRPETGLLASLFEAPSIIDAQSTNSNDDDEDNEEEEEDDKKSTKKRKTSTSKSKKSKTITTNITKEYVEKQVLNKLFKKGSTSEISINSVKCIGTVIHKFSHINQTLTVYDCPCNFKNEPTPVKSDTSKNLQWLNLDKIQSSVGMAKQMSKCFDLIK